MTFMTALRTCFAGLHTSAQVVLRCIFYPMLFAKLFGETTDPPPNPAVGV